MEEEQQPQQIKQPNKYLDYIKNNKYTMYTFGGIAILFIVIIAIIIVIIKQPTKNQSASNNSPTSSPVQTQTNSPSTGTSNISAAPSTMTFPNVNPTQAATIENQLSPQISPEVGVQYTVAAIKTYDTNWALVKITNPDVGPAYVVMKNTDGKWDVVLGPGTHFDEDQLQQLGAPVDILNDANTGL